MNKKFFIFGGGLLAILIIVAIVVIVTKRPTETPTAPETDVTNSFNTIVTEEEPQEDNNAEILAKVEDKVVVASKALEENMDSDEELESIEVTYYADTEIPSNLTGEDKEEWVSSSISAILVQVVNGAKTASYAFTDEAFPFANVNGLSVVSLQEGEKDLMIKWAEATASSNWDNYAFLHYDGSALSLVPVVCNDTFPASINSIQNATSSFPFVRSYDELQIEGNTVVSTTASKKQEVFTYNGKQLTQSSLTFTGDASSYTSYLKLWQWNLPVRTAPDVQLSTSYLDTTVDSSFAVTAVQDHWLQVSSASMENAWVYIEDVTDMMK